MVYFESKHIYVILGILWFPNYGLQNDRTVVSNVTAVLNERELLPRRVIRPPEYLKDCVFYMN